MKRFAVVLCAMDEDLEIKFFNAETWREAALEAAEHLEGSAPWNCLDVPDEAMEEGSEDDAPEPVMVPLTIEDAVQDATNADQLFAIAEVPTEVPA